ncbi:MAG: carboxypeptidase-like regulatory domain-containing protein, partial [Telluria sp.]
MLRKTVLVRALSIAFSAAALSAAVTAPSMAQSNASGNINGTAEAGTTISLLSLDTGLKRTVTPGANGKYTITALPIGRYKVDMIKGGSVVKSSEVEVIAGQGVDASFAADPSIQMVKVSGRLNRIDVSNTNNGATFTARELAALPIAKSVDAIIQLAPNTTRADSRYAAGASFGGGG